MFLREFYYMRTNVYFCFSNLIARSSQNPLRLQIPGLLYIFSVLEGIRGGLIYLPPCNYWKFQSITVDSNRDIQKKQKLRLKFIKQIQLNLYITKLMRKTNNIMIRESAKKSAREAPQSNTSTSFRTNQSKLSSKEHAKKIMPLENIQMHKEMVRAENLTEEQHKQILKEARKTVTKKIRTTQTKIQSEIVNMLESQCTKLGAQLQKQKLENQKLRFEVEKLRKNISYLNEKLEKTYADQSQLNKNNAHGKAQKEQLYQEIQSLKSMLKRQQDKQQFSQKKYHQQIQELQKSLIAWKNQSDTLKIQNTNLLNEKEQFEEQLQEKQRQIQQIRGLFQMKKKQWDGHLKNLQKEKYEIVEKKGEKITKYQAQTQKLVDKLKEEETARKKLAQKNKQFEKNLNKSEEARHQLQEQIVTLKKRVNDLSILKSSNNSIMNQKISKITQQNQKLKQQIQSIKNNTKKQQKQKPFLFGPEDYD